MSSSNFDDLGMHESCGPSHGWTAAMIGAASLA
jgi:hypothetical protein